MSLSYQNTFAGLAQAAIEAGLCATAIEEFEAAGVTSLEELIGAWTLRSDRSDLMINAEAVLIFVF